MTVRDPPSGITTLALTSIVILINPGLLRRLEPRLTVLPSIRSSRWATGIFTPLSRNNRQIARFTSERTLLTPFIGSAIQKRTSMRMP